MCRKLLIEPARFRQTMMHAFPLRGQAFAELLAAEALISNDLRGDFSDL
jgi:hypothetical protein